MPTRLRASFVPVAVAVVASLSGCGGGEGPASVAETFVSATADGDGKKACTLVNRETAEDAKKFFGSCEEGITELFPGLDFAESKKVEENGDKAKVELEGGGKTAVVRLEKEGDKWKIAGAG